MTIRIGIIGYGNLGRGIENAIANNKDMKLVAVFTRRNPNSIQLLTPTIPVVSASTVLEWKDKIDVLVLAGGSATDLPFQTPTYAEHFNVIDTFDTHKNIPMHLTTVDKIAKENHHLAIISIGWDPGVFSLFRLLGNVFLPKGNDYTFWGKGVSQGHSDAIRRIPGVKDAKQYTCPIQKALESVRNGKSPVLTTREKHTRECFVVLKENADAAQIEKQIKNMPNYFDEYETTVHFISQEEFNKNHQGLAHGGFVFRTGTTGINKQHHQIMELQLTLDSNPEFTAHVAIAYARALMKLNKEGVTGCKTIFDIAPSYLSPVSKEELIKDLL